eukprot:630290-Amphidinium_carterae.1
MLAVALDMYRGRRRVLVNGAVSSAYLARSGLPAGCALAVDLLDCFLSRVLGEASIRQISFRKYVDDLVLYSTGQQCGNTLLQAFKEVRGAMTTAGMVLNPKKTKVVVNGRVARQSVKRSWRGRNLPALELTVRDLGVDVQWAARRNPVQRTRVGTFAFSMKRLQLLGLPKSAKARVMSALWSQGMYGAEVNGLSQALVKKLRIAGRAALGKGLARGAAKDPQVVADATLLRTWDRWIQKGGNWPPRQTQWDQALRKAGGPLSALAEFAQRVSWHPGEAGWQTTRGFVPWCQASATGAQDSQAWLLKQLAKRRADFEGLETGLDPVDLQQWRKLSNKATHAGRAACNAAAGGLWHEARLASVFEHDGCCMWCQDQAGSLHHLLYDCPAWDAARREAGFALQPDFPPCLQYHGLVPAPRLGFQVWPEVQALELAGDTLWVDGSGRAPNDSPFRTCSWAVVGKGVL